MHAARADEDTQSGLRPRTLDDYVGQDRVREEPAGRDRGGASASGGARSRAALRSARARQDDARATSSATSWACRSARPPARSSRSRATSPAMLTSLQERDVLFIDEIHRMEPAIEEILYPAMEDYELDIVDRDGPGRVRSRCRCRSSRSSARPRAPGC